MKKEIAKKEGKSRKREKESKTGEEISKKFSSKARFSRNLGRNEDLEISRMNKAKQSKSNQLISKDRQAPTKKGSFWTLYLLIFWYFSFSIFLKKAKNKNNRKKREYGHSCKTKNLFYAAVTKIRGNRFFEAKEIPKNSR